MLQHLLSKAFNQQVIKLAGCCSSPAAAGAAGALAVGDSGELGGATVGVQYQLSHGTQARSGAKNPSPIGHNSNVAGCPSTEHTQ
ncbi:hypothetical protein DOY81_008121 [Sarcophaga bullata]|nr:hypothetical protein DOY81_008121 [Sarcophaga bullata]